MMGLGLARSEFLSGMTGQKQICKNQVDDMTEKQATAGRCSKNLSISVYRFVPKLSIDCVTI